MSHRFKQLDSRAYCLGIGSSLGLPTLNLGPDLHAEGKLVVFLASDIPESRAELKHTLRISEKDLSILPQA